jgi:hypothetical protein
MILVLIIVKEGDTEGESDGLMLDEERDMKWVCEFI